MENSGTISLCDNTSIVSSVNNWGTWTGIGIIGTATFRIPSPPPPPPAQVCLKDNGNIIFLTSSGSITFDNGKTKMTTEQIINLIQTVNELKQEVADLKDLIQYMPGGSFVIEAQKQFEAKVEILENKKHNETSIVEENQAGFII